MCRLLRVTSQKSVGAETAKLPSRTKIPLGGDYKAREVLKARLRLPVTGRWGCLPPSLPPSLLARLTCKASAVGPELSSHTSKVLSLSVGTVKETNSAILPPRSRRD